MVLADSFYYQPVQIDTINTRVNADLFAKEGDANGRGMVVQITENGIIKDTTGITLRLQWSHMLVGTSGFTEFEVVDATKGLYKLQYPTSMLHRGNVEAFIRITDNDRLSGTRNLLITVERMVGSDEAIAAADDYTALQTALTRLSIWEAAISGKVDTWEADMEATKQLYIDTLNDAEGTISGKVDTWEVDMEATKQLYIDTLNDAEGTISGKVDTWEADMEATKQLYIDTLNDAEGTYSQELVALQGQLAETVEDVELAHSKIKRNNENTFGTYENAVVESIIANDEGERPEVLGIRLEDDHMLAIYTNRDSVASYRANRSRKPTYNIDNVVYTVNSVTVPYGINLSKIKKGMIIDTKHNPKFSGFIVGVEGQKILINNWYKVGNTSKGQVPSGTTGILVDPMTTPWVDNANLYLDAEDDSLDGVVSEMGIINQKADNIGKGVNVVSLGTKSPEVGFKTTGGSSPFIQGFNAGNSRTAFINSNENTNDFLLYNEKTGYRIKNSGRQNKFLLEITHASTNRTFDPRNAPIFLINTPGIVKIVSPSNMSGAIVYVLNVLASDILMEWPYWNPTQPGSITIPAKSMKTLVSDGGTWYHF